MDIECHDNGNLYIIKPDDNIGETAQALCKELDPWFIRRPSDREKLEYGQEFRPAGTYSVKVEKGYIYTWVSCGRDDSALQSRLRNIVHSMRY